MSSDMKFDIDLIITRLEQLKDKEYESSLLTNMLVAAIADDDFKKRIELKNQLQMVGDEGTIIPIQDGISLLLTIDVTDKDGTSMSTLKSIAPKFTN